ncbi:MAG: hypothetical protein ABIE23_05035 [archaeon]
MPELNDEEHEKYADLRAKRMNELNRVRNRLQKLKGKLDEDFGKWKSDKSTEENIKEDFKKPEEKKEEVPFVVKEEEIHPKQGWEKLDRKPLTEAGKELKKEIQESLREEVLKKKISKEKPITKEENMLKGFEAKKPEVKEKWEKPFEPKKDGTEEKLKGLIGKKVGGEKKPGDKFSFLEERMVQPSKGVVFGSLMVGSSKNKMKPPTEEEEMLEGLVVESPRRKERAVKAKKIPAKEAKKERLVIESKNIAKKEEKKPRKDISELVGLIPKKEKTPLSVTSKPEYEVQAQEVPSIGKQVGSITGFFSRGLVKGMGKTPISGEDLQGLTKEEVKEVRKLVDSLDIAIKKFSKEEIYEAMILEKHPKKISNRAIKILYGEA